MTSIKIHSNVTIISSGAFANCKGLKSFDWPDSVTEIWNLVFEGCVNLKSIKVPKSVVEIGEQAFYGCSNLTDIIIASDNPKFTSVDGVIYNKEKTEIVSLMNGFKGNFAIPNGVLKIGYWAFNNCTGLTSVTIPASVTEIGDHAFSDCSALKEINVSSGNRVFSSVDGTLYNKRGDKIIRVPEGASGKYTIPSNVSAIGDCAFLNCFFLTEIEIPESVTDIAESAFHRCTAKTNIEIPDPEPKFYESAPF